MGSTLEPALEAVLDGHAVAFLGAGFSIGAQNSLKKPIKAGAQLAEHLAAEAGAPLTTPLDQAAELYVHKIGTDRLISLLRDEFTCDSAAPWQVNLAKLPWKRVYTTNFDDVFEVAREQASGQITPVVLADEPGSLPKEPLWCVHINGFIRRITPASIHSDIKLTTTSYLTEAFQDSRWSQEFRYAIDIARHVFFIGYSLYDLDIKRILFASDTLRDKCFFITSRGSSEVNKFILSQFGEVAPIGADAFAGLLDAKVKTYTPRPRLELRLASFREHQIPTIVSPELRDDDAISLFMLGESTPSAILASVATPPLPSFHLHRQVADAIAVRLTNGSSDIVIHSELGNGKSILIEEIALTAAKNGFRVFSLFERKPSAETELDQIIELQHPTLICIESYPDHLDLLKRLQFSRHERVVVLVTARSYVHDIFCEKLADALGNDEPEEFDVNRLSDKDNSAIVDILDRYGLWGDLAATSKERKSAIVRTDCRNELHAVLLKAFESPVIKQRLSELVVRLNENRSLRDIAILVMILQELDKQRSVDFLMQVLGSEAPNQAVFRSNSALRQILSFQSGEVRVKNPVLADVLLRSVFDGKDVVSVLKKLVTTCHDRMHDDLGSNWNPYRELYKDSMQFGKIQRLLSEKSRLPLIREFYEYVKTLRNASKHPHFWLQYAVAMLSLREYGTARQYFKSAYSFAENNPDYDKSFIDNHFARFLLETTIYKGAADTAMDYFNDAAEIILRQARRPENRFYPYRVASKIREFYDRFSQDKQFSMESRRRIVGVARDVLSTMTKLDARVRSHRDVLNCERQLSYLVTNHPNG